VSSFKNYYCEQHEAKNLEKMMLHRFWPELARHFFGPTLWVSDDILL
jgi:hypothetical protein